MPEYALDNGRVVSSPLWWIEYYQNPHRCTHKANEKGLCRFSLCPKQSMSYSFPMAWWKNKETCNYVDKTKRKRRPRK